MTEFLGSWKKRARELKIEVYAIYLAYRDPRLSLYARLFAACVVAYAFSPIDLIPDPIPIWGYLDDLVLIPPGVSLVLKMIPPDVMAECRGKAQEITLEKKPVSRAGAVVIVLIWLSLAGLAVALFLPFLCQ